MSVMVVHPVIIWKDVSERKKIDRMQIGFVTSVWVRGASALWVFAALRPLSRQDFGWFRWTTGSALFRTGLVRRQNMGNIFWHSGCWIRDVFFGLFRFVCTCRHGKLIYTYAFRQIMTCCLLSIENILGIFSSF